MPTQPRYYNSDYQMVVYRALWLYILVAISLIPLTLSTLATYMVLELAPPSDSTFDRLLRYSTITVFVLPTLAVYVWHIMEFMGAFQDEYISARSE